MIQGATVDADHEQSEPTVPIITVALFAPKENVGLLKDGITGHGMVPVALYTMDCPVGSAPLAPSLVIERQRIET